MSDISHDHFMCFFSNYNPWYIPWYQWYPLWHDINDIPYEAWFLISILLLKSKKIWGTPQWCLGHMAEEKGTRGDGSLGKHRTRRASGVDVVTPKSIEKLWFATILGGFWLLIWLISFFGLASNRCYGGMWQVKSPWFWPICISMDVLLLSRFQDEDTVPSISPIDTKLIGMKEPTITAWPKSWVNLNHGKSPKLLREHED